MNTGKKLNPQQLRDKPLQSPDVVPLDEVYKFKDKCEPFRAGEYCLQEGEVGWVDVPGETERHFVLYSKASLEFLAPAEYARRKRALAAENRKRRPYGVIRQEREIAYKLRIIPQPARLSAGIPERAVAVWPA